MARAFTRLATYQAVKSSTSQAMNSSLLSIISPILQSPIPHMMLRLPLSHDWWVKEGPPDELFSPRKEVRTKLERYSYNSSSQFMASFPHILQYHSMCTWYLASFPGSRLAFRHWYCKWWKGGQENGSYTANKLNATTNKHSVSMQQMSSIGWKPATLNLHLRKRCLLPLS